MGHWELYQEHVSVGRAAAIQLDETSLSRLVVILYGDTGEGRR